MVATHFQKHIKIPRRIAHSSTSTRIPFKGNNNLNKPQHTAIALRSISAQTPPLIHSQRIFRLGRDEERDWNSDGRPRSNINTGSSIQQLGVRIAAVLNISSLDHRSLTTRSDGNKNGDTSENIDTFKSGNNGAGSCTFIHARPWCRCGPGGRCR